MTVFRGTRAMKGQSSSRVMVSNHCQVHMLFGAHQQNNYCCLVRRTDTFRMAKLLRSPSVWSSSTQITEGVTGHGLLRLGAHQIAQPSVVLTIVPAFWYYQIPPSVTRLRHPSILQAFVPSEPEQLLSGFCPIKPTSQLTVKLVGLPLVETGLSLAISIAIRQSMIWPRSLSPGRLDGPTMK